MDYDPTLMRGREVPVLNQKREWLKGALLVSGAKGQVEIPFDYSKVANRKFGTLASSFPIDAITISETIYTSRVDLPFAKNRPVKLHDGKVLLINNVEDNINEYGMKLGVWVYLGVANG